MRVGDIYKYRDGIRRLTQQDRAFAAVHEFKPLTVADLFREAGFPVPEDQDRLIYSEREWIAYNSEGGGAFYWDSEHWQYVSEEDLRGGDGNWIEYERPNLARLPAADAWDCLPEVVKAIVKS